MNIQNLKKQQEAELDILWNEHDGTHFYKDEFRELLSGVRQESIEYERERIKEIIRNHKTENGQWILDDLLKHLSTQQK